VKSSAIGPTSLTLAVRKKSPRRRLSLLRVGGERRGRKSRNCNISKKESSKASYWRRGGSDFRFSLSDLLLILSRGRSTGADITEFIEGSRCLRGKRQCQEGRQRLKRGLLSQGNCDDCRHAGKRRPGGQGGCGNKNTQKRTNEPIQWRESFSHRFVLQSLP